MTVSNLSLLKSTIKNIRSESINISMKGYTIHKKLNPVTAEEIKLYAAATGDSNPIFQSSIPPAPPFFVSRLIWDPIKEIISHNDLKLNFFKMVHCSQSVSWAKPIMAGDQLNLEMIIKDIIKVSSGEILELSGRVFDNNGDIAAEAVTGLMIRNLGKKDKSFSKTKKSIPDDKNILFELLLKTWKGQNLQYADISGDRSFTHTNNFLARLSGLPGTIMHGICVMSMACSALSNKIIDGDYNRLKQMNTRFSSWAVPGETLTLKAFASKNDQIKFSIFNPKGIQVQSMGTLSYK